MTANWGRRVEGLRLDVANLRGGEARAFSSGVRARLVLITYNMYILLKYTYRQIYIHT
jgi:hypothetical protein